MTTDPSGGSFLKRERSENTTTFMKGLGITALTALTLALSFSLFYSNKVEADVGLVAHWTFDDGSGSTATDTSGFGHTGTINGPATWVAGKIGDALSFNGTSNYVRVANFSNPPSSTMTLCGWIKTSSHADESILSFSRNPAGHNNEGIFKVLADGDLQFWDYSTTSIGFSTTGNESTRTVNDGNWHLACFVKNGLSGTYYIDGAQSGTTTAAVNVSYGTADWVIGTDYRDGDSYFNGLMDDMRVYNIALMPQDISSLYGFIGYWKFDDGSGSAAIDSSGYNDPGTLVGTTSPSWVAGKIAGALSFTSGSSVLVPNAPILNPTAGITIAAWVNTQSLISRQVIASKSSSATSSWLFEIDPTDCGAGKLHFVLKIGSTNQSLCSATALNTGTWHEVAASYDGSTQKIFIDGTQDAAQSVSGAIATTTVPIVIGDWADGGRTWSGDLDDVRLYSRGLLNEEVASLAETLPGQVLNLTGSGNYLNGFALNWSANPSMDKVTDYVVQYATDPNGSWTTIDTTSTSTSYTVTGLAPGTYYFEVAAVNVVGNGPDSNQVQISSPVQSYTLGNSCLALEHISTNPGDAYGHYSMGSDIDCSGIPNFSPINFGGAGFMGTFDGQGHSITHLTIDTSNLGEATGLFMTSSNATFENLNLVGGSVIGDLQAGSLAGFITESIVSNVHSNLPVTDSTNNYNYAYGGLIGQANQGIIASSSATGNVTALDGTYGTGGLIGYVYDTSIDESYATGTVYGSQSVGGLVGDASDDGGLQVTRSYASGSVTGGGYVGGLVGAMNAGDSYGAIIANSYASGRVNEDTSLTNGDNFNDYGGLAGYASQAQISTSYYAGSVHGGSNVGGLIGEEDTTSISDSFSAASVTADSSPLGAVVAQDNDDGGYGSSPQFDDVIYDASSTDVCDGVVGGSMSGCTDVNTVSSPNPTYFFNTTLAAPFSAGTSTPIWDFTSIWKEHATTYPTFQSFYSAPSSSQNNGTSSGGCGSMFTTVGNTTYITTCGVTSVYSVASTPTPISTPSTASTPASSPTGVSTPPITSPASSAQSSTASTQTSTQTSAPANTTGPVTANGSTGTGYSTASVSSGNELSTAFLSGYVFKRNLKKGMTGDDVQMLQRYLNAHGFLLGTSGPGAPGSETTLFSSRTESAVKRFQAAHAADILSPQSLAAPTGWFYTYTRAYANAHMM